MYFMVTSTTSNNIYPYIYLLHSLFIVEWQLHPSVVLPFALTDGGGLFAEVLCLALHLMLLLSAVTWT